MKIAQRIIPFIVSLIFFNSLNAQVPEDTIVMYAKDSAVVPDTEQTVLFFQENERIPEAMLNKITVVTKARKTMKLAALLKTADMKTADYVLADMDGDGKKELLFSGNTGGAHCCDELYIYKNIGPNKYQHVAKLFAGNTVITDKKEFRYNLYENFGYFFTCYACGYSDTSDAAPVHITTITLRYNKGKLSIIPGDTELRSTINDNLGKLGEQSYKKIDPDLKQDDGQRKEFAINLAVYYYSFGRNMVETQKLFNKYYKFPDAKEVWNAFVKQINYMKKINDF